MKYCDECRKVVNNLYFNEHFEQNIFYIFSNVV